MKCNNCGMENSSGTIYCSYCGNKFQNNNYQGNNSSNKNNGDTPLILGVISIVLFLFGLRLVAIITSTIGLIMAIRSENNNNRTVSIVMNSLVLGLSLIMLILLVILVIFLSVGLGDIWKTEEYLNDDYQDDYEYVEKINGTYNCHSYYSDKYEKVITIDDEIITIEDYDNPLGTYLSGPYSTEYVSYSGNVYQLKVNVNEKYENGDEIPSNYKMNIDMTFSDDKVDVSIDYVDKYRCDIVYNGI